MLSDLEGQRTGYDRKDPATRGEAASEHAGQMAPQQRGGKAITSSSNVGRTASRTVVGSLTSLTWGLAMLGIKVGPGPSRRDAMN